jgi:hypothetical protein
MKKGVLTILFSLLFTLSIMAQNHPAEVIFRDGSKFSGYADFDKNGKLLFRVDTLSKASKFEGLDVKTISFTEEPYNVFDFVLLDGNFKLLQRICEGELMAYAYYNDEYSFQITLDDSERATLERLKKTTRVGNPGIMDANGVIVGGGYYNPELFFKKNRFYLKWADSDKVLDIKKGFRKNALEIFKDCPYLVEIIENKEWKYQDMPKIVEYYNEMCAL